MSHQKTIALDFDGVLHSYTSGWTGPVPFDPPVPGAQAFVEDLIKKFHVVIFSRRALDTEGKAGIIAWLKHYGFPYLQCVPEKPNADLYVDDRGFRFEGDFDAVRAFIDDNPTFNTWNRKGHQHK